MRSPTHWGTLCSQFLVLCWLVRTTFASDCTASETQQPVTGYGFELVMARLDHLQQEQLKMMLSLRERDEELREKLSILETLCNFAGHNLTTLQEQSRKILLQQTACASHEQMRKEIAAFAQRESSQKEIIRPFWRQPSAKAVYQSCTEVPAKESAVYRIQLSENDEPFEAFCEQKSFGGGWLVVQYRFDGSLDFYRNWSEYRNGFGSAYQEHWIGLERLYRLTTRRPCVLLVEIKDFEGYFRYALYKKFEIGSESEQYALKKIGPFVGTAGDSLGPHIGSNFTTKDRDNDRLGTNCAVEAEGAWWYNGCSYANLNGRYAIKEGLKSMFWYHYKNKFYGLASARMMIREVEG